LIFKNYGGSYQLRIQDVQDLEKVQSLDDPHWAATSVPIDRLNCDRVLTSYVDTDKNGRIRTDEVKAALVWLFRFLPQYAIRQLSKSMVIKYGYMQLIASGNPVSNRNHKEIEGIGVFTW